MCGAVVFAICSLVSTIHYTTWIWDLLFLFYSRCPPDLIVLVQINQIMYKLGRSEAQLRVPHCLTTKLHKMTVFIVFIYLCSKLPEGIPRRSGK